MPSTSKTFIPPDVRYYPWECWSIADLCLTLVVSYVYLLIGRDKVEAQVRSVSRLCTFPRLQRFSESTLFDWEAILLGHDPRPSTCLVNTWLSVCISRSKINTWSCCTGWSVTRPGVSQQGMSACIAMASGSKQAISIGSLFVRPVDWYRTNLNMAAEFLPHSGID